MCPAGAHTQLSSVPSLGFACQQKGIFACIDLPTRLLWAAEQALLFAGHLHSPTQQADTDGMQRLK